MSVDTTKRELQHLKKSAASWLQRWGGGRITEVRVNPRLRRVVGRALVADRTIELRRDVLQSPTDQQLEIVCHEAAHLAVTALFPKASPHGAEWRRLVESAGYAANATRSGACEIIRSTESSSSTYRHTCLVCGMTRHAKRPVNRWRCAACVAAGLDGALTITRQTTNRKRA